jgi:hypothetical protein
VSQFRSSQDISARSDANFGIKGTLGRVLINAQSGHGRVEVSPKGRSPARARLTNDLVQVFRVVHICRE